MTSQIETYISYINSFDSELNNVVLDNFISKLNVITLKKNEVYIKANKTPAEIGFITSGLIRSYFIDENGAEKTISFFSEGHYVGDYDSLIYQKPTQYCFQCLEPTTLVQIAYKNLNDGINNIPSLEKHSRILAEQKLHSQNQRLKQFLTQTAEQRYLHFVNSQPTLFNRISISHLCSYLGIQRQSLTRIRKKIMKK